MHSWLQVLKSGSGKGGRAAVAAPLETPATGGMAEGLPGLLALALAEGSSKGSPSFHLPAVAARVRALNDAVRLLRGAPAGRPLGAPPEHVLLA